MKTSGSFKFNDRDVDTAIQAIDLAIKTISSRHDYQMKVQQLTRLRRARSRLVLIYHAMKRTPLNEVLEFVKVE